MSNATNPLLEVSDRIPFDRIEAEHVEPGLREALARAQADVQTYEISQYDHLLATTYA